MKNLKKKVFALAVLFAGAACTCLIAMGSGTNYWNDDEINPRCYEKYSPGCRFCEEQVCCFWIEDPNSGMASRSGALIKCNFPSSEFTGGGSGTGPGGGD